MDPESRVNFGKTYTVEHNVKVYDFGHVDKNYLHRLRSQWKQVWDEDFEQYQDEGTILEEEEEDEDEEDSGSDDGEGYDNE
jgi:hypothetical protein